MYWVALYLAAVSASMTICRLAVALQIHIFSWGILLTVAGWAWYFWQEKYGTVNPSTQETVLKYGLIPTAVISCLIAILR